MTDARHPVPEALLPYVEKFLLPEGRSLSMRDPEAGLWCIELHGRVLDRAGRWVWEPLPSSRSDQFKADTRYTLTEAFAVAREAGFIPDPEPAAGVSAIEQALAALKALLVAGAGSAELHEALATLAGLRISAADVAVHIERWRAVNDVTDRSEAFENAALDALDMTSGWCRAMAVQWRAERREGPAESRP